MTYALKPEEISRVDQMHRLFDRYAVDAESVTDFLARYYRRERYAGRGADYAACLLRSYEGDFEELGICWISHHDNVTGDVVSFLGKGKAWSFEQKRRDESRAISVRGWLPGESPTVPTQIAVPGETQRETISGKPQMEMVL